DLWIGDKVYCRDPLAFVGDFVALGGLSLALERRKSCQSNENGEKPPAHPHNGGPKQRPESWATLRGHISRTLGAFRMPLLFVKMPSGLADNLYADSALRCCQFPKFREAEIKDVDSAGNPLFPRS